jgi:Poly(ADP-ribose) polymerase catalytic domain
MATFQAISLSSKIYDDICGKIRASYPKSCVLYIEEVINDKLQQQFADRKSRMQEIRGEIPIQTLQLFHGTAHRNIDNIAKHGFQKSYNKTSAYGKGTYFATAASYSRSYTNSDKEDVSYMFLCDVLVGKCFRFAGGQEINTDVYDNSVDNLTSPTIYVSPYNDGCIPRYLIAFHKNAK